MNAKAPQTKRQLIASLKRLTNNSITEYYANNFDTNKRNAYYFEAMQLLNDKIKQVNNL